MKSHFDDVAAHLRSAPRTWLVTGAAGFIGSHLVEHLLQLGQRVVGIDKRPATPNDNLSEVAAEVGDENWTRFERVTADLAEPGVADAVCVGADYVLHHAATAVRPQSAADLLTYYGADIDAFIQLLTAARDARVKRVVYASSAAVYRDAPYGPRKETEPLDPESPDAAAKVICETYAATFHRCFDLPTTGLRYFNVFGPRQSSSAPGAVIPQWLERLSQGNDVGGGGSFEVGHDFCFVRNVVRANLLAAVSDDYGGRGRRFNIGAGECTTLFRLYWRLRGLLHARKPELLVGDWVPDMAGHHPLAHSFPDLRLAHGLLGYEPVERLDAGLAETYDWYCAQRAAPTTDMPLEALR